MWRPRVMPAKRLPRYHGTRPTWSNALSRSIWGMYGRSRSFSSEVRQRPPTPRLLSFENMPIDRFLARLKIDFIPYGDPAILQRAAASRPGPERCHERERQIDR